MSDRPTPATTGVRDIGELLEETDLDGSRKELLRSRYLDQMRWMEAKAVQARRRYYALRIPTVIGSVAVPVLVSLGYGLGYRLDAVSILTVVVSTTVGILLALEELFHFRETWRHYRRSAELLKAAGWQFLLGAGPYRRFATQADAYPAFVERVEEILSEDVEGYLERVAAENRIAHDPSVRISQMSKSPSVPR
jgi:hypothetical protein